MESAEAKAERISKAELQRLGWTEQDLKQRHKSDLAKLALAWRVRQETTLTLKAIAGRLYLGTWKSARTRLQNRKTKRETHGQILML